MDFTFTDDQLLFQESVRDFLVNEVTPARIRATWDTDTVAMLPCGASSRNSG